MHSPEKDRFLSLVCSDIPGIKSRAEVYAELEGHIDDKTMSLMESGMPEEIALSRAVFEMGNPNELKKSLGELHSYDSAFAMSGALLRLIFGIIFVTFTLNFPIIKLSFSTLGVFFIMLSLFQLKDCCRELKIAHRLSIPYFALIIVSNTLSILSEITKAVSIVFAVLLSISMCLLFYYIFTGLDVLARRYSVAETHPVRKYGIIYCIISALCLLVFAIPAFVFVVFIVAVVYLIGAVRAMFDVRRILRDSGEGDNILNLRPKGYAFLASVGVLFVAVPLLCAYFTVTPSVNEKYYTGEFLSNSSLPRQIESFIPTSVSSYFEDMEHCELFTSSHRYDKGALNVHMAGCDVPGGVVLLSVYEWEEMPKGKYIDSLVPIHTYYSEFSICQREELILMYETDGRVYSFQPQSMSYLSDGMALERLSFRLPPKADRMWIIRICPMKRMVGYDAGEFYADFSIAYIHRNSFFCYPYSESEGIYNTSYLAETFHGKGYVRFTDMGLVRSGVKNS